MMTAHRVRTAALAIALCFGLAPLASARSVSILPLGDSITQGKPDHPSYRWELFQRLVDAKVDFDFVGSTDTNRHGTFSSSYKGRSFDRDHEGHWGWTANNVLDGRDGRGKLSEWTRGYTADVAMVHLGTNDANSGHSTSSTIDELGRIIDTLRRDNSRVTVLLAKIIPTRDGTVNRRVDEINARIDSLARDKSTSSSKVVVVDQNSGFSANSDLYDSYHPDSSGEAKIAKKWFDALMALSIVKDAIEGVAPQPEPKPEPEPDPNAGPVKPSLEFTRDSSKVGVVYEFDPLDTPGLGGSDGSGEVAHMPAPTPLVAGLVLLGAMAGRRRFGRWLVSHR